MREEGGGREREGREEEGEWWERLGHTDGSGMDRIMMRERERGGVGSGEVFPFIRILTNVGTQVIF